jgi:predicted acetyltransferase
MRQVYDATSANLWGPLFRSELYWQWLIGRKAHDQVLLAVRPGKEDAPAPRDVEAGPAPMEQAEGYAVICGSCIVEMVTVPQSSAARLHLLARACREAMDRDHNAISLYSPASDPLHELLVTAGGAWIDDAASTGPRWMMRLLSPEKWVERCYPLWRHRAQTANVPRPFDLGIVAGESTYRFTLTRRSSRLEATSVIPADRVTCDPDTLASLLTGNVAVNRAIAQGRMQVSRPELMAPLTALFPARLFWQSSLDLMRL